MQSKNIIYKLNSKGVFICATIFKEESIDEEIIFGDETVEWYFDLRDISAFGEFDHTGIKCSFVTLKNGDYYLFLLPPEKIQSLVNSQIIYSYKTN